MRKFAGMPFRSFTIHPAVCEFMGQWWLFYHNGALELNGYEGDSGRRSICLEPLSFREDGSIAYVEQR